MSSIQDLYNALLAATAALGKWTTSFPRPGGNITAINNLSSAAFTPLIGANANRNSITFVNPGQNIVMVAPTTQGSSGGNLTPTATQLGGTFPVVPGAFVTLAGVVQQAWQGMATAGSSQPFTIMDQ